MKLGGGAPQLLLQHLGMDWDNVDCNMCVGRLLRYLDAYVVEWFWVKVSERTVEPRGSQSQPRLPRRHVGLFLADHYHDLQLVNRAATCAVPIVP